MIALQSNCLFGSLVVASLMSLIACGPASGVGGGGGGMGGGGGGMVGGVGGMGGGGGGMGGGGQGGSVDPATLERIFQTGFPENPAPSQCASDADCPQGEACFLLAKELGICDPHPQITATSCTPPEEVDPDAADECGCGDLTCAAGMACVSVQKQCACGPPTYHNACVEAACQSPADCADGTVCTPSSYILPDVSRCISPRCQGDADCTDGPEGRCSAITLRASQSGGLYLEYIECVYKGPTENACDGTGAKEVYKPYYSCPSLEH